MALNCENNEDSNLFGFTEGGSCDFFGGSPPLPSGVGWGVVIGFGFAFSLLTTIFVWIDLKFGKGSDSSEQFNTAGRSIKTGLTASVIVSQWTWAATLLQSSNVAFKFGVSGPFWYASGATIQVLLFGILAIEVKRKAPTAHTILEIVQYRFGPTAHKVFMVFCFLTNIIVTAMLILGGASVVNALTGINLNAAAFLIPIGVVLYTAAGGLKATFFASYIHTDIIYAVLVIFMFLVYASSGTDLGSPSKVYENLQLVAELKPVEGNKGGSFLTMLSESGLIFGIINIVGNFGTVFVDQSYWQSAIAAKPSATYKGYILGGLCWFAIPFSLATALGLASRALDLPISIDEANSGLVPPAVAEHLLGKVGAVLILLQLFMAVTSTGSAEQIAVSSLVAYDVYRTYMNPKATGKDILKVSRIMIVVYAFISGVVAVILFELGLSLGWVYLGMGVIIGSAVIPLYLALTWDKTSPTGAILGAIIGQLLAVMAWLVRAYVEEGVINVDSTGKDFPMLTGNLVAILSSGLICVTYSLIFPDNFDWEELKKIPMIEEDGTDKLQAEGEDSYEGLTKALQWVQRWGTLLTIVLVVVWPLLALPAGVFSEAYFTMWVILAIVWGIVAALVIVFLPIIESFAGLKDLFLAMVTCSPQEKD